MAGPGNPKPQTSCHGRQRKSPPKRHRCAPKIRVTSAVEHRLYLRATSETRSMITSRQLAPLLVLAALPLIGACQRHEANTSAAAPAAAATTAAAAAPQTVLGKTVDSALRKARDELEKGNIDISRGVDVQMGEHGEKHFAIGAGHGDGKAEITPAGDLLLQGKPATITPAQRALLLQYRQQIISVAETGMAIGVKGADLAGKALAETFSGLMHGDADQAEGVLPQVGPEHRCLVRWPAAWILWRAGGVVVLHAVLPITLVTSGKRSSLPHPCRVSPKFG